MARSIKKGPYVFGRLLKKVQKLNEEGKKEREEKQIEKRQRTGPQEYTPDGPDTNTKRHPSSERCLFPYKPRIHHGSIHFNKG